MAADVQCSAVLCCVLHCASAERAGLGCGLVLGQEGLRESWIGLRAGFREGEAEGGKAG